MPGVPLPGYRGLQFGLPAHRLVSRLLRQQRTDATYIATEGPLGYSALEACIRRGVAALTGMHTNLHQYSTHYGAGILARLLLRYLRRFLNRAAGTLVPTATMRDAVRADARCVLVGGRPAERRLRDSHAQAIFASLREGAEPATHYASADLFLFPSETETFGNVTLEAMAAGLAIVAYDLAAAHEPIRDGHNGLLAPAGAQTAFIERACRAAPGAFIWGAPPRASKKPTTQPTKR